MAIEIKKQQLIWNGEFENRKKTDKIILHHVGAVDITLLDIHNYHLSMGLAGVGYHFYIRKDGCIYLGRPEKSIGAHAPGFDNDSVGICFEGDFDSEEMSEPQVQAGKELIAYIKKKYGIAGIYRHSEVDFTACPGVKFPYEDIALQRNMGLSKI